MDVIHFHYPVNPSSDSTLSYSVLPSFLPSFMVGKVTLDENWKLDNGTGSVLALVLVLALVFVLVLAVVITLAGPGLTPVLALVAP